MRAASSRRTETEAMSPCSSIIPASASRAFASLRSSPIARLSAASCVRGSPSCQAKLARARQSPGFRAPSMSGCRRPRTASRASAFQACSRKSSGWTSFRTGEPSDSGAKPQAATSGRAAAASVRASRVSPGNFASAAAGVASSHQSTDRAGGAFSAAGDGAAASIASKGGKFESGQTAQSGRGLGVGVTNTVTRDAATCDASPAGPRRAASRRGQPGERSRETPRPPELPAGDHSADFGAPPSIRAAKNSRSFAHIRMDGRAAAPPGPAGGSPRASSGWAR